MSAVTTAAGGTTGPTDELAGSGRWAHWARDAALWALLSAPIAWALISPPSPTYAGLRLAASLLVMAAAVGLSRRWPLVSLVLVILPTLIDGNFAFAIPVVSYLVGLRMTRARPAGLVFAIIALGGTVLNLAVLDSGLAIWFLTATTLLFAGVFPWLVGRYRRQHQELTFAGWERADLLERERRGADERVRMRERARIAQDMHDSLGHELSLIALRAGALEVAPDLDERHRRVAGELRASVASATLRLRDIIGVLREDAEPAPTQPTGEGITGLVERARDAGMTVRLSYDGAGHGLAPMAERAAHRVVQEALTNANRYAPGAPVTVRVITEPERTAVVVHNERPPAGPLPDASRVGSGSGLIGLRERVRLAGGTLSAGPRDGGFEVVAHLPHVGAAPVTAEDLERQIAGSRSARQLRRARERVRRSLLVALAAPAAIAAALLLVYYPVATFDSVLEADQFDRLRIGQQRGELRAVLPGRSVPASGGVGLPVPPDATCEYYTDGNFPFAEASYRLCFAGGRLVAKDRVAG